MKKNTGEGKGLENTDDVFGISISFSICETLSDDASLLAQEHARSQSRWISVGGGSWKNFRGNFYAKFNVSSLALMG